MAFSIRDFTSTNKGILIWAAFLALVYFIVIKGLFSVVFLTYILCFIFNNLIERITARVKMPRRLLTIVIYVIFLSFVILVLSYTLPKLGLEATNFLKQVPQTLDKIYIHMDNVASQQPKFAPVIDRMKEYLSLEKLAGVDSKALVSLAVKSFGQATHYLTFFFLGTLFSFLILMDYPHLKAKVPTLRETRLREVYEEMSGSIVRLGLGVGEAFQAQIIITTLNTMLTGLGLLLLGIHPIALLCTIVFFAGLIPVFGVFISSAPILLLGFNIGGWSLVFGILVMIVIVHTMEAYVLNPRIMSAVFKINPVLTLAILYIGHSLFGLWGMILGVPVTVFFYRDVILGRPVKPRTESKKMESALETPSSPEASPAPGKDQATKRISVGSKH